MKYKIFVIPLLFLTLFSSRTAFASISFNHNSPQIFNHILVLPTCTTGNVVTGFFSDGTKADTGVPCNPNSGTYGIDVGSNPNYSIPDTYTIVECDTALSLFNCGNSFVTDITDARADLGYISETTYTFTTAAIHPGIAFFGGVAHRDSSTPTPYEGVNLTADVASAVGDTNLSVLPVAVVVIGIILAFLFINFVMKIWKIPADPFVGNNKKSDLVMYHMSDREMKSKGIPPGSIEVFDEPRI